MKKAGQYLTKKQLAQKEAAEARLRAMGIDPSERTDEPENTVSEAAARRNRNRKNKKQKEAEAEEAKDSDDEGEAKPEGETAPADKTAETAKA